MVRPARPTPSELKPLSDIDSQEVLRVQIPSIWFYPAVQGVTEGAKGKDPAKVIKAALAEALVYYYPWAGRLREGPARKLVVDCTAEGVVFVEADADVRLEQLGEGPLHPPFPWIEDLLYNKAANLYAVVDCHLLTIQVTRLQCGGFILALSAPHAMCDARGLNQFITAVTEFARGAEAPSILPVWRRELLNARSPPRVTCTHHEFDIYARNAPPSAAYHYRPDLEAMVYRTFFFGRHEVTSLRRHLPLHLLSCASFELLAACLWHCRTAALQLDAAVQVRLGIAVDTRHLFDPPLPAGYYGNACAYPIVVSPAGKLVAGSLEYAVELVKRVKDSVTEEYMRSTADLIVLHSSPNYPVENTFVVSDTSRLGYSSQDFGWGKPVYAGTIEDVERPDVCSYFTAFTNAKGEGGRMVTMCLPVDAMKRFVHSLEGLLFAPGYPGLEAVRCRM